MVRRIILFVLMVSMVTVIIHAEKAAVLAEIKQPKDIAVDDARLYVSENAVVFIYSLSDYRLTKTFGRQGQGPQEFQTLPHVPIGVDASTDKLIVSSIRKISYYTKEGEFINEVRAVNLALRLRLFGDKFLGWSQARDKDIIYSTVNLYDAKLNKLKEIYRVEDNFQGPGKGLKIMRKPFSYHAYDGKILLPGSDDASIDVFDGDMNKQLTIRLNQERRKLDEDFKKKLLHYFKTSPESKNIYERYLKPIIFPEYFPVIANFFVDPGEGGTIYVQTWKRENDANEFFTYDMEGKFKKRLMIPIRYETDIQAYPTLIYKGKLYQIVENEKTEQWELHVSKINP